MCNLENVITKRSSAGAVGAGTKSTEKKEVEKKEKYVTGKKKRLPAPLAPEKMEKKRRKKVKKVKMELELNFKKY